MGIHWRDLRGKYIKAIIADMVAIPVLQSIGGLCAFLEVSELPKCTIYPARPMKCRLYPYVPQSPSRMDSINLDGCCKGVGVGEPTEPPWSTIESYYWELKFHYSRLHQLVFEEKYEPLQALEKLIDEVYQVLLDE